MTTDLSSITVISVLPTRWQNNVTFIQNQINYFNTGVYLNAADAHFTLNYFKCYIFYF